MSERSERPTDRSEAARDADPGRGLSSSPAMEQRGPYIAELLRAGSRAHAAGAVLRQGAAAGHEAVPTFEDLVADSEHRVLCLAEALALGVPEILHEHLRWARVAYAARGVPDEFLPANLEALGEELLERLPKGDGELAAEVLSDARAVVQAAPTQLPCLLSDDAPHVELARKFLLCVLEGRRTDAIELVVGAAEGGVPLPDLHHHVIARVQSEVGRMWQMGEVHVADEHLGSRVVEDALTRLRERIPASTGDGHRVLVATVGGDLHDIGSRMVADQFEMAGWQVLFLGANTPTPDLVRAVRDHRVELLAVSASVEHGVGATADLIAALRAEGDESRVPVLVGGRIFAALPQLWRAVGADGCAASSLEAPEAGRALVEG